MKKSTSTAKEQELKKAFEAKDAAKDKKKGIKENSKRDIQMDSPGMLKLKAAVMGRKKGKGGK